MFEVFTTYKSFTEFHCRCDTEQEAEDLVEELKQDRNLDDAYYVEEGNE